MSLDRRGFAPITLMVLIVAGIIVLGGVFYYVHKATSSPAAPVTSIATSTTPTSTSTPPATTPTSTPTSTAPITIYRSYITPTSGPVGTTVTIHGSGFAATGNQVTLDGMVAGSLNNLSSPDGKTLTFVVPFSLGPNCKPDQACPQYLRVVTDGSYAVSVISNGVTQNFGTFTVTASASAGPPTAE